VTAAVTSGSASGISSNASKRWLAVGFVLSTLFTTGLTLGGGYFVQTIQARQTDRKEQIDQFRSLAGQMDPLVTAFQEIYLAGGDPDAAKRTLQKNIQDQYTVLERAEGLLAPQQVVLSQRYRNEIVEISTRLDSLPAPGDARELIQSVATARDTRIDVEAMLQAEMQRWF